MHLQTFTFFSVGRVRIIARMRSIGFLELGSISVEMIYQMLLFGPSILYILLTGYTVILDLIPGLFGLLHGNITVVQSVILCMGWLHGMNVVFDSV